MFTPLDTLDKDYTDGGIIKLWFNPNIENSVWETKGTFGVDCYKYFFVPSRFSFNKVTGVFFQEDWFLYVYVNINNIWKFYAPTRPAVKPPCILQTDSTTKLPFLNTTPNGLPDQVIEKCYFIPCDGVF